MAFPVLTRMVKPLESDGIHPLISYQSIMFSLSLQGPCLYLVQHSWNYMNGGGSGVVNATQTAGKPVRQNFAPSYVL